MKLASCKSALNLPPPTPTLSWFTLLTVLRRWSRCLSYSLLLCGLFYEAICFMSYLVLFCCVFSVLSALRLPRLGKRELILVLFVCLFDLRLFGFVWCLGRAAACDCGTLWTFPLPFCTSYELNHMKTMCREQLWRLQFWNYPYCLKPMQCYTFMPPP